jgi:hypothetical protein
MVILLKLSLPGTRLTGGFATVVVGKGGYPLEMELTALVDTHPKKGTTTVQASIRPT